MRNKINRVFIPDKIYRRLSEIDIENDIVSSGIKLVILDIDGTLKNRFLRRAPKDVVDWTIQCRNKGLYICFVSNDRRNRHVKFADDLDLPLIAAAHKPSSEPLRFLLDEFKVNPEQAVLIGNNPFTDILGAHRMKMRGYLVRSIETTRIKKTYRTYL